LISPVFNQRPSEPLTIPNPFFHYLDDPATFPCRPPLVGVLKSPCFFFGGASAFVYSVAQCCLPAGECPHFPPLCGDYSGSDGQILAYQFRRLCVYHRFCSSVLLPQTFAAVQFRRARLLTRSSLPLCQSFMSRRHLKIQKFVLSFTRSEFALFFFCFFPSLPGLLCVPLMSLDDVSF